MIIRRKIGNGEPKGMRSRKYWEMASSRVILGGLLLVTTHTVGLAGTHAVNSTSDDAVACAPTEIVCLREAIAAAATDGSAPAVVTVPAGTYNLTRGALTIFGGTFTIEGSGANTTIIKGVTGVDRVFDVYSDGVITFRRLGITGGNTPGAGGGIQHSSFFGTTLIDGCSISGNSAGTSGGGISVSDGTNLEIRNSTIANNFAGQNGGGLSASGGSSPTKVRQSTISSNTSVNVGGGIRATQLEIIASTIVNNGAPNAANLSLSSSGSSIQNSIVANPLTGSNCGGSVSISLGYNIFSSSCGTSNSSDRIADPQIELLAANGGATETHALKSGSPALDAITSSGVCSEPTDQRGVTRPQGAACDIGAFEYVNTPSTGTLRDVISWFQTQVANGAIVGAGTGSSASGRLNALQNMLLTADNQLARGHWQSACAQLRQALRRSDGHAQPDDFVTDGSVVGTLASFAGKIAAIMSVQGCTE